ncbi:uncharacterized protein MONOS_1136 [Monocercomonoides exilis]|uniref:uncharacterized protein n=1 Tax=Monocercomonoides exilis TaxID=2049356 RepID=UPI00355A95FB|nr:hypothetical protein MONOS_1136 [Monocercomonoides exilis]|eukprot:MONOS_1136.1-p1 / transcript=MONOS_1136.1 / gene=MONOS_1136 / organism=Monocercomonoides_exilis_PA203 / gene_product=unspecified product / transcript_product=unspecified product / location=Mono_scaffold00019:119012-123350(-) / protein_length=1397 / sequence_SO=supercontig / SO=protein_coding / is_pseudo=false
MNISNIFRFLFFLSIFIQTERASHQKSYIKNQDVPSETCNMESNTIYSPINLLTCLNGFSIDDTDGLIALSKKYLSGYAYRDRMLNPPSPFEGSAVDILEILDAIESTVFENGFQKHVALTRAFLTLNDPHTSYGIPCSDQFCVVCPYNFYIEYGSNGAAARVIAVEGIIEGLLDLCINEGMEDIRGSEIVEIALDGETFDGKSAVDTLVEWAVENVGISRTPAPRVSYTLMMQFSYRTGGDIGTLQSESIAVRFKNENGDIMQMSIPFLALASGSFTDVNAFCPKRPLTIANEIANQNKEITRNLLESGFEEECVSSSHSFQRNAQNRTESLMKVVNEEHYEKDSNQHNQNSKLQNAEGNSTIDYIKERSQKIKLSLRNQQKRFQRRIKKGWNSHSEAIFKEKVTSFLSSIEPSPANSSDSVQKSRNSVSSPFLFHRETAAQHNDFEEDDDEIRPLIKVDPNNLKFSPQTKQKFSMLFSSKQRVFDRKHFDSNHSNYKQHTASSSSQLQMDKASHIKRTRQQYSHPQMENKFIHFQRRIRDLRIPDVVDDPTDPESLFQRGKRSYTFQIPLVDITQNDDPIEMSGDSSGLNSLQNKKENGENSNSTQNDDLKRMLSWLKKMINQKNQSVSEPSASSILKNYNQNTFKKHLNFSAKKSFSTDSPVSITSIIEVDTLQAYFIPSLSTGVLVVSSFLPESNDLFALAAVYGLQTFLEKQAEYLIIDVRGNTGGDGDLSIGLFHLLFPDVYPFFHTSDVAISELNDAAAPLFFDGEYAKATSPDWTEEIEDFYMQRVNKTETMQEEQESSKLDNVGGDTFYDREQKDKRKVKSAISLNTSSTPSPSIHIKSSSSSSSSSPVSATLSRTREWTKPFSRNAFALDPFEPFSSLADWANQTLFDPQHTLLITNGLCGSACAQFSKHVHMAHTARIATIGIVPQMEVYETEEIGRKKEKGVEQKEDSEKKIYSSSLFNRNGKYSFSWPSNAFKHHPISEMRTKSKSNSVLADYFGDVDIASFAGGNIIESDTLYEWIISPSVPLDGSALPAILPPRKGQYFTYAQMDSLSWDWAEQMEGVSMEFRVCPADFVGAFSEQMMDEETERRLQLCCACAGLLDVHVAWETEIIDEEEVDGNFASAKSCDEEKEGYLIGNTKELKKELGSEEARKEEENTRSVSSESNEVYGHPFDVISEEFDESATVFVGCKKGFYFSPRGECEPIPVHEFPTVVPPLIDPKSVTPPPPIGPKKNATDKNETRSRPTSRGPSQPLSVVSKVLFISVPTAFSFAFVIVYCYCLCSKKKSRNKRVSHKLVEDNEGGKSVEMENINSESSAELEVQRNNVDTQSSSDSEENGRNEVNEEQSSNLVVSQVHVLHKPGEMLSNDSSAENQIESALQNHSTSL